MWFINTRKLITMMSTKFRLQSFSDFSILNISLKK